MSIMNIFESNFNNEKLKSLRMKRNLSLLQVSELTSISETTLHRYENGITRKIPLESLKKLAELYDVDYTIFYGWKSFPLFGSLSGIILSVLYGVSLGNMLNGASMGVVLGMLGFSGVSKYFEKMKSKDPQAELHSQFSEKEKKEYELFKQTSQCLLRAEDNLSESELKEAEKLLFSYYLFNKIKRDQ